MKKRLPGERATTVLWLGALLGAVASLTLAHRAAARPPRPVVQVWVAHESEKLRPAAPPPDELAAPRIELDLAGQDCQGAQIAVRAARPLQALRATAAPLDGPGRGLPVALSRVATISLVKPSGPDGATGEWPDALVPDRDALFDEPRRAFPIDLPAGRTQTLFVEVCTAARESAGSFTGAVRLSWQLGGKHGGLSIPVHARVRSFALPATPPLATAFGFSGYSAMAGHHQPEAQNRALTNLYDRLALRRGITLYGGTQNAPDARWDGSRWTIDWTRYDEEVAPFLDGTALPSGARWQVAELREPRKHTREQRRDWRKQWQEHFEKRGWLDRLFIYVHDEPPDAIFDQVAEELREAKEDAPRVRRLVTTAVTTRLGDVDLWTPPINCFDPGAVPSSCYRAQPREAYDAALQAGARLFWYQACGSHGCNDKEPSTDEVFSGWPSYAIDAKATAARAMGALAFTYRVAGELYYDVDLAYDGDVWKDQWRFGGNGDGTLYYPGTPEKIGGTHDVPVESLRLIQIARALGDHAALTLCKQLGDPALAEKIAHRLGPSIRRWEREPAAYSNARSQLYDRIEELASKRKPRADVP